MLDGTTRRPGTLVDIGGGIGVGTEEAMRVAPSASYTRSIVLEPQRGMLLRASRRRGASPTADRVRGTGTHLPLADGSAEVLLSFGVLCCMEAADVPRAVAELWRVLRQGGYTVLGVPRGWAPTTDELFRPAGFVSVRELRPGRVLYRKPPDVAGPDDGITSRA
jgi:ubiquinone/menaquinone biosynthesis C-methylase UbiE